MRLSDTVEVNDGGVNVPQVYDFCLLISVLMQDSVGTDEEENSNPHDERAKDLQLVRVQIPVETQ